MQAPPNRIRLASVALGCLFAACMAAWNPPEPRSYHRTAPVEGAEAVGAEVCGVCHEEVGGHAPAPAFHADCEACHGPGSRHVESVEVAEIRFPSSADCLACHETGRSTHLAWSTGSHERAGVRCSDCHDPHNREPLQIRRVREVGRVTFPHARSATRLCLDCHPEIASRLDLQSHHPVREGMLGCTDCHGPHEDPRTRLGTRTALCEGCHQDHAGPWIFEHAPVAEDCAYCHDPHGSPSYNLLDTSQPGLCLACHTLPALHDIITAPETYLRRCTDCHGAIHGSYQDHRLLR